MESFPTACFEKRVNFQINFRSAALLVIPWSFIYDRSINLTDEFEILIHEKKNELMDSNSTDLNSQQ